MPRLRQRDLTTFSKVLAALHAHNARATLADRILTSLHGLIPCEFTSFSLMNARSAQWHSRAMTPGVSGWPGMKIYQQFYWEDPLVRHIVGTGTSAAMKISDFVSLRQYRSSSVYSEIFGRVGCDRRIGFGVLNTPPVDLSISLNRSRRDFTEEERGLLDLLRPHVVLAYSQANAQQKILREHERERADERARLGETFGVGLAEINDRAQLLWITPRAETLLAEFFPLKGHRSAGERLPTELEAALRQAWGQRVLSASEEASLEPLNPVWYFAGPAQRRLKVRLVPTGISGRWHVLLEETGARVPVLQLGRVLGLTLREAEVLSWLKEGKTNWEIGAILGNAEKTVGKHLENIFRKLKVENRTAAVRVATENGFAG